MVRVNVLLIFCMLVSLLPYLGTTQALADGVQGGSVTDAVYAVSQDGSKKLKIDYINFNVNTAGQQKSNYVALYTSGTEIVNQTTNPGKVLVKRLNVAIQVNAQGVITDAIGPLSLPVTQTTQWEADQYMDIPQDGFVLVASDNSWNTAPKYRSSLFDLKDSVLHLERGGQSLLPAELLIPSLLLTTESGTTVTTATYTVEGRIAQYASNLGLTLKVGETDAALQANGSFSQSVTLTAGANTIAVKLFKNQALLQEQTITIAYQQQTGVIIELEAPPDDITIVVEGPKKRIDYIDKDVTGISNIFALYTTEFGPSVQIPTVSVAIQVDSAGHVTRMVNPSVNGGTPSWTVTPTTLEIPQGGYVVMAQDNSYATNDIKRFLATKFKVGDVAKLRKNGNVIPVSEIMTGQGQIPRLMLDNLPLYTIKETSTTITGKVTNPVGSNVTIDNMPVAVQADGTFRYPKQLVAGPNYMDVVLTRNDVQHDKKSVVVYSNPALPEQKQVILWVDQASNARKLQSSASVLEFLRRAKDAGVTDIAFDVKGVEGFVSYKKNDLTHRPYVSEMTAPERRGSNPELDLLEEFITHSRTLNLKIHAAFNVFAEGSIAVKDFAVIDQHLDWEEQVYRSDDNGQIKRLRDSEYGKKGLAGNSNGALVLFVNPANDQVRDYQLQTFEEVLKNYDVDGIILDRGRYDNETADFSDVTKAKFVTFLQQRGKQLNNWPDDIFRYVNGVRTNGPLIQDWWEFRSGIIESFVKETKDLVENYESVKNRTIQTSAYVGAWFESYYLNGVHWGSKDFRYDSRLGFPNSSIYTPEYYETGYISYLDFLMVGTYYTTTQEIQRYLTIDSIVTNGEVPIYAGMALTDLQSPALQKEIFQNAMGSSNGLMLFDASLANWPIVKASINNQDYVKDYQIGVSKPGNQGAYLEGSYYNVSRNTDDINVYTEEFGTSTGTNKFGVEVVTDASGVVTAVINKTQASTWNWTVPQDNNSVIPAGGMVVSAIDQSGIRTNRQLLANTYSVGDSIRAAALSGYMAYDSKTVTTSSPDITGNVKVMGAGSSTEVKLNGVAATVSPNGDFTGKVSLVSGSNTVTYAVYVDGMKTNEKSIQLTYNPTITPPSGSGPVYVPPATEPPKSTDRGVVVSGTLTEKTENGKPATQITVDADTIRKAVELLANASGKTPEIIVEVPGDKPVAIVSISAQALVDAAKQAAGAVLNVQAGAASYKLPLDLIDIQALAQELGAQAGDVQLIVKLEKKTGAEAETIAADVKAQGGVILGDIYDFQVLAQSGTKEVELSDFGNRYVQRTIALQTAPAGNATAVVIDADTGVMSFVPALFETSNGSTVVTIKRTGNSTYAIVELSKSFADTQGHWAQADIDQLASKLLVQGVTENEYAPEKSVTRAEFAALLVRALGIVEKKQTDLPAFKDVRSEDWYAGVVAAAAAAGLIEGYEDGTFRPNAVISREELAVLATRAYKFTEVQSSSGAAVKLEQFTDAKNVSNWAREAVGLMVNEGIMNGMQDALFAPQEQTSRAQAAVLLKRLAVKLSLLDDK
ncbi:MAG: glycoside hydrolase [Paenibacillus sp.]|nr:glycoside hydrolase [Paenibacillus sp.]